MLFVVVTCEVYCRSFVVCLGSCCSCFCALLVMIVGLFVVCVICFLLSSVVGIRWSACLLLLVVVGALRVVLVYIWCFGSLVVVVCDGRCLLCCVRVWCCVFVSCRVLLSLAMCFALFCCMCSSLCTSCCWLSVVVVMACRVCLLLWVDTVFVLMF